VVLSRQPADYTIYVRSASFSEQDAAALFAVIWKMPAWPVPEAGLPRATDGFYPARKLLLGILRGPSA
jgi:hypothetical protein